MISMKLTPVLIILASSSGSIISAATITYGFQASDHTPTSSRPGFNAGDLTEVFSSANPGAIFGGFTGPDAPVATTTVRAFRPADVTNLTFNPTNAQFNSHTSYVEFTVTPGAGQQLDFSAAQFSLNFGTFVGVGSTAQLTNRVALGYRINGTGDFTMLASSVTAMAPVYVAAPNNWTGQASFDTNAESFVIVENSLLQGLSEIPALTANDTITFRVILGDSGTTGTALTATSNVRGGHIDAISVSGFNVIPEPSVLGIMSLSSLVLGRRKRRV